MPGQSVEADFDDVGAAREAIEALGRAGLEGQHITLRGAGANAAASRMDTKDADARFVGYWARTVLFGALFGGGVGLFIGLVFVAVTGTDSSTGIALAIVLPMLGLSTTGALIASMWPLQATETWSLTFQPTRGKAVVGVQSGDRDEIDRATRILQENGSRALRRA